MVSLGRVLSIGLAGYKGMTPAQMEASRQQMVASCSNVGITFDAIFIQGSLPAEERATLKEKLTTMNPDVVHVGSGLRLETEHTRLLEDVVNMVLSSNAGRAPKLAFATAPDEMIPTFQRLLAKFC